MYATHVFVFPIICDRLHEVLLDDVCDAQDEKLSFRRLITATVKGDAKRSDQGLQVCMCKPCSCTQGRSSLHAAA